MSEHHVQFPDFAKAPLTFNPVSTETFTYTGRTKERRWWVGLKIHGGPIIAVILHATYEIAEVLLANRDRSSL